MDKAEMKAIVTLLQITLKKNCSNEMADEITKTVIDLLETKANPQPLMRSLSERKTIL